MFLQVNRPRHKDAWERWQDSLHFLSTVDTRTVLRMTIIRGYNYGAENVEEFARVMSGGDPHFIEIKSYMHVGMSAERLEWGDMLSMEEVRSYSGMLCEKMPAFSVMDESEVSKIVVLQNKKRFVDRWIKSYL
jgi:tRNA wybutosine-synthesizing protein 1